MRHGSLFSGIGGFDLASEWMGWENVFHCEWNEFGQRVLKYYWPDAETFTNITKTDFTKYANKIDILTGGFPCQPYSQAGKRLGKEDERHLWPEMLRAIQEVQPKYIVGENVSGLINWNGGMVFNEVQIDLENQGYQVTPFILPACAVNAPHRRDRVWFIAYSSSNGYDSKPKKRNNKIRQNYIKSRTQRISSFKGFGNERIITNSKIIGLQRIFKFRKKYHNRKRNLQKCKEKRWNGIWPNVNGFSKSWITSDTSSIRGKQNIWKGKSRFINKTSKGNNWKNFPTQSPICDGDDGLSSRLDGITFPKWRNESIKAGGNAIVPQVALQIFKAIEEYERRKEKQNS